MAHGAVYVASGKTTNNPSTQTQKGLVRYSGAVLLQPAPEDTSTELDPKYQISYLATHEVAERPIYETEQEEAVAAAFAFSQLEASLSGVRASPSNAEAISRQGMTASTSGTTVATENGDYYLDTASAFMHVRAQITKLHPCNCWSHDTQ